MSPFDPTNSQGMQFRPPAQQGTGPMAPQPEMREPSHIQQTGMTAVPSSNTHTWNFHHVSSMDGKTYEGQFTCKKLSIMELSRLGVRKTQLNGGFHYSEAKPGVGVEEHIDSMNSMIAHLELAVIQAPVWFNPEYLYDPEVIQAVYVEVVKFENSFFRPQRSVPQPGGSGSDDRSGAGKESGSVGRVAQVGGVQVSDSLDP